jgi:hypothetical protein
MSAKKIPFGFVGPTYVAQSPIIDNEIAMNCYLETSESEDAATPRALLHTPGRKKFATLPEGKVPGGFSVNGRSFFAVSNLYEVNASGEVTDWGSLGANPVNPTMLTANETQLVIVNNGNLYVFTLKTNTLVAVDMGQFNGPVSQITMIDGYILASIQNSHTFQQSNLEDATTWDGLNIATISYFPDNIISMIGDHRELWFWSAKRAIGYYNAGAGFPVFIPIQGAEIEDGAGASFATVQADNAVLWLEQDERGSMVAKRLNGYSGQRISTHAVELAWQQYKTNSDAVGWTYQEYGHTFWVIYFPAANATWVFDIAENQWHQRGFWVTQAGKYIADRAMCHTFNFGKHLVGDWASGIIYDLSSNYLDDDGNPIRGNRRSPTIQAQNKWIYFDEIEFVMETGLAPSSVLKDGAGNVRPAQIMLRWSNDGGKTWSNWYYLSVGLQGEYDKRVIKRMLGRARKRQWDVAWTDPYPYRFNDAFVRGSVEDAA